MRAVVSDSGPLICLGRLDLLRLLPALFAEVQVPEQVVLECASRPQSADAVHIAAAIQQGWLTPCGSQPIPEGPLGRGERAAIARAQAIGAGVLTDDQQARDYAESLQLVVIGTLGVLIRGKRAGLVTTVAPLIERLRAGGVSDRRNQALSAAGEAPE